MDHRSMPVPQAPSHLSRLLDYLESDPANLALLADAASAAVAAGEHGCALDLIERCSAQTPLSPALLNLRALALMGAGRLEEAASTLENVRAGGGDTAVVRFNQAWALAMAGDPEAALGLLDEETVAAGSRGAALKVNLLHRLERPEEALEWGAEQAERHPEDQALMGALASAALDAERVDLARDYAQRAGGSHDGMTTLGLLLLDDEQLGEAEGLFDRVLAGDAGNARALLGKGLGLMAEGRIEQATAPLDAAAERFGDHLGSWVAAGWAHYLRGDLAASRARFETALAIDDTFAETQGGLAVLDLAQGDAEGARRRAELALRLDRTCFAGALAKSMLLERDGKAAAAAKVRDAAMNFPIGTGGRTIARSLSARRQNS